MLIKEPPLSEFTATPITLEQYARRPAWEALPLQIKIAVVHLWRAEREHLFAADHGDFRD
jgi:hypothetical protein